MDILISTSGFWKWSEDIHGYNLREMLMGKTVGADVCVDNGVGCGRSYCNGLLYCRRRLPYIAKEYAK